MPRSPAPPAAAAPRQSLASVVYESLLARLRTGAISVDDRLVDLEIAAELGVSRMPVREALLQLVSEGFLVSTSRGYRIPVIGEQDVREVFELRLLLEPHAAALAARDITRGGIARLGAAVSEARAAQASGDAPRMFQANFDFRSAWVAAVHNQRLAAAISRYADQIFTVRHTTLSDAAVQPIVVGVMEDIYQAFLRHDSVRARDAMLRFLVAAQRSFEQQVQRELRAASEAAAPPKKRRPRAARPTQEEDPE